MEVVVFITVFQDCRSKSLETKKLDKILKSITEFWTCSLQDLSLGRNILRHQRTRHYSVYESDSLWPDC
jgi:hypothetical protein